MTAATSCATCVAGPGEIGRVMVLLADVVPSMVVRRYGGTRPSAGFRCLRN